MQRRLAAYNLKMSAYRAELDMRSPVLKLRDKTMKVSLLAERIEALTQRKLDASRNQMKLCAARLASVNPMAVLSKGYTFVVTEDKKIVSSAAQLSSGERIDLIFSDGEVSATVDKIITTK